MRPKHKPAMIKAVWSSHQQLRGYIGWAKYARSWDAQTISNFVDDHITAPLPNQHFVFLIGNEIVGVGSLVGAYTNHDSQIALWTLPKHHGKGIGKAIVDTLTYVAFNVWGYAELFYEHDSTNESSKKLPQKCGFTFSHTRSIEKSAERESGFWFSWKKLRPEGLPDAIIQGRPVEDFIVS
jgi:RimJ/RimL family protein N-acetyltransferase